MSGFGGCASVDRATPRAASASRILRVDSHTHIFNGEDIDGVGYLLQENHYPEPVPMLLRAVYAVTKLRAPGAEYETRMLDNLLDRRAERRKSSGKAPRNRAELIATLEADTLELAGLSRRQKREFSPKTAHEDRRREQDRINVELAEALGRGKGGVEEVLQELQKQISDPVVLERVRQIQPGPLRKLVHPATWWKFHGARDYLSGFLKGIAAHRLINAVTMMRRYPDIDLFVAATLDVDQWFVGAAQHGSLRNPSTSMMAQVEMMGKISVLTEGCVLGRTGYDPLRQGYFDQAISPKARGIGDEPLKVLKASCEKWGAVGAKIYPVVGFRPLFNAEEYGAYQPRENRLYPSVRKAYMEATGIGIPEKGLAISFVIDDAMRRMFAYCNEGGYSVMAHTNHSHGSTEETMKCTGPEFFAGVASKFRNLRINLGHFGGLDSTSLDFETADNADWEKSGELGWPVMMAKFFGKDRRGLYADFSFTDPEQNGLAVKNLAYFLRQYPATQRRAMYGSDWHELLSDSQSFGYYKKWTRLFEQDSRFQRHAEALLGQNAIEFLGLRKHDRVRRKLDAFFDGWNVQPEWAALV
ncbi:MAG: hypothetical protein RL088_3916 [Verrucomicrobiota bacterium]